MFEIVCSASWCLFMRGFRSTTVRRKIHGKSKDTDQRKELVFESTWSTDVTCNSHTHSHPRTYLWNTDELSSLRHPEAFDLPYLAGACLLQCPQVAWQPSHDCAWWSDWFVRQLSCQSSTEGGKTGGKRRGESMQNKEREDRGERGRGGKRRRKVDGVEELT